MSRNVTDSAALNRPTKLDELLDVKEVIAELGIAKATFYRWRVARKGPEALRLPNGSIRVRRSALEAFLAECARRDKH